MGRVLMLSILKAKKRHGELEDFYKVVHKLGSGANNNKIGNLIKVLCVDLGVNAPSKIAIAQVETPAIVERNDNPDKYDEKLAEIVSAVGSAEDENERAKALNDLRSFIDQHNGLNLEAHFAALSAPFRAYIMSQVKPKDTITLESNQGLKPGTSNDTAANLSVPMSERLRYLKSKLSATEAVMNSMMAAGNDNDEEVSQNINLGVVTSSENSNTTNLSSIRKRLVAANEMRANARADSFNMQRAIQNKKIEDKSSIGSAAALRKRLESVKRNKQTS